MIEVVFKENPLTFNRSESNQCLRMDMSYGKNQPVARPGDLLGAPNRKYGDVDI